MLLKDIQRIATQLNIPLCRPVNVTIPYITRGQRSNVATIVNKMVRRTTHSAWVRQAERAHIRIVSSAPLNVRRAFERPSNTHQKAPTRPQCFCSPEHLPTRAQAGTVRNVGGHYALLPINILHNGAPLRGIDPLPCSGAKSRQRAITGLLDLARTLHVGHTYTHATMKQALPESEWDSPPLLRTRVTAIADSLSTVACIRVAGKAQTMLFAFCRQWVWDLTISFLETESTVLSPWTTQTVCYHPCNVSSARTNGLPTPHDASRSYIYSARLNHYSKEPSYGGPSLPLSNHRFNVSTYAMRHRLSRSFCACLWKKSRPHF